MESCVRPGDVVLAEVRRWRSFGLVDLVDARFFPYSPQVLSLGDSKSYFLTIAKNALGVVFARSEAGHPMAPVDATHMECPVTRVREGRKIAQVAGL